MKKNSGLGRGLDHLFSRDENIVSEEEKSGAVETVSIEKIQANQHQPRKTFNTESLQELAQSIKNQGVVQPLIVRKISGLNGKEYEIVAGERRYRSALMAGLAELPVIVRDYSDTEAMTIALIENLQREDLNAIDEAEALNQLKIVHNLSQEELAEKIGKSRSNIANTLRLLALPENIKRMIANDQIKAGHGRALLCITNLEDQQFLCSSILEQGLTVRDVENALDYWKENGTLPQELVPSYHEAPKNKILKEKPALNEKIKSIDAKLKDLFHKKAAIKGTEDKGSIKINYKNKDELLYILSVFSIDSKEIE